MKLLAVSTLVAAAAAVGTITTSVSASASNCVAIPASLEGELVTALPASILAQAAASPCAFSSEVASEFAAGSTPAWFKSLPANLQSALTATASAGNATTGATTTTSTGKGTTAVVVKTTGGKTTGSAASSASSASASASSAAASSSSSSGGASMPTAVVGAGLAGAMGIFGLLAL